MSSRGKSPVAVAAAAKKVTLASKGVGAKKHRKVLRNNIEGITKPALIRIARRAGVKRMSSLCFHDLRWVLKAFMEKYIQKMVVFVEVCRRKTVEVGDLKNAFDGSPYSIVNTMEKREKSRRVHKMARTAKAVAAPKKDEKKKEKVAGAVTKPHRFHPGTVALREIKRQQKSTLFMFRKASFNRLVREIFQEFSDDLRYRESMMLAFQLVCETYLVDLMHSANSACIHAKRQSVKPVDIQFVRKIRGERA